MDRVKSGPDPWLVNAGLCHLSAGRLHLWEFLDFSGSSPFTSSLTQERCVCRPHHCRDSVQDGTWGFR